MATRRHRHGLLGLWLCCVLRSGQLTLLRDIKMQQGQVISCLDASVAEHQRASESIKVYGKYMGSTWEVYRRLQRRLCILEPTRICFWHAMDPVWQELTRLDTVDGKPERKSSPCSRAACHDPCPSFAKAEECYRFAWEPGWRNAKQVFWNFIAHYLSASDLNMGILCVFQVSFLGCAVTWVKAVWKPCVYMVLFRLLHAFAWNAVPLSFLWDSFPLKVWFLVSRSFRFLKHCSLFYECVVPTALCKISSPHLKFCVVRLVWDILRQGSLCWHPPEWVYASYQHVQSRTNLFMLFHISYFFMLRSMPTVCGVYGAAHLSRFVRSGVMSGLQKLHDDQAALWPPQPTQLASARTLLTFSDYSYRILTLT